MLLDIFSGLQRASARRAGMKLIEPPDRFHLLAALGWLELGNQAEAHNELAKVALELRNHPEVLKLRWRLCAKTRNLDTALEIAQVIFHRQPDISSARGQSLWVPSTAASESDGSAVTMSPGFPLFFAIPYNMACYACQSGNLTEAWDWFQIAAEMVEATEVRKLALSDPDLQPLWPKIVSI